MIDARPVDALTSIDLARFPVWEFVDDDSLPDETYVRPVTELPVGSLASRIAAAQVALHNAAGFGQRSETSTSAPRDQRDIF